MESLPAAEVLLSGRPDWYDAAWAERLAEHLLRVHRNRKPPPRPRRRGPREPDRPSNRHPVFYGCSDWQSAVHAHWTLVRGLRMFEADPDREVIVDSIGCR